MGEKMDDLKGRVKEGVGAATDDKDLEREGKADRVGSDIKEGVSDAIDKVKDAAKRD
ncbi:MAG: CsbD family protein [Acidimicrobiales bacterium]